MESKTNRSKEESVRTTISLAGVTWRTALRQMAERGFNDNLSSYIADLIRRADDEESARTVRRLKQDVLEMQQNLVKLKESIRHRR